MKPKPPHNVLNQINSPPIAGLTPTGIKADLARVSYSSMAFSMNGPGVDSLIRDYNAALLDLGFGLSRRELRKKDIIDTRNLIPVENCEGWEAPQPNMSFEDKLFLAQNYWYAFIPCFDEGVLHINTSRYIYWRVELVDFEQNRMNLYLHDYIFYTDTGWQPGVSGVLTWSFDDPATAVSKAIQDGSRLNAEYALMDGEKSYVDIYTLIDVRKKLHWDDRKADLWNSVIVGYARRCAEEMEKKSGNTAIEELASMFANYTIRINRALSENKSEKPVSAEKPEERKAAVSQAKARGEKPPKERKMRLIGGLKVTSRETPKPSGQRRPPEYKLASWNSRGHIRTYKNGKKVYIRPAVHRRKCLIGKDAQEPIPTTIKFKDQNGPPPADGQKGTDNGT